MIGIQDPIAEIAIDSNGVALGFAANGSLIVESDEPAINLFGLGVYFWPELLGAVAGIVTLLFLWRLWRVLRTPAC